MKAKGLVLKLFAASAFGLFSLHATAAAVVLDSGTSCNAGNASNGISVSDVTGNMGGATECWGTFNGNTPGPTGDGFDIGGTIYAYVAKEDTPGGLDGADIGLSVTPSTGALSGAWSFDPSKFAPSEFLIVLKSANTPGYAVWLFDGETAASSFGDWSVAWGQDLSHLSIYAPVPVPAAVWLFGSGLLGLVGVARRKRA